MHLYQVGFYVELNAIIDVNFQSNLHEHVAVICVLQTPFPDFHCTD